METSEFLSRVLGDDGFYCIFAVNGETKRRKQKFYTDRETLERVAYQFDDAEFDTYFALATFEDIRIEKPREAANAKQMRAFFLDLDCGPGKDFADQGEALAALRAFIKQLKLPKPLIVNSGRGLHVYWPLETPVAVDAWLPVAKSLKRACAALEFGADPAVTADAARILRVPGTHNYKDSLAPQVHVLAGGKAATTTLEAMQACLSGYAPRIPAVPKATPLAKLSEEQRTQMNAATKHMLASSTSSFKKILKRSIEGRGCEQIRWAAENQADTPEPLWRAVLSVAQACKDSAKAIHAVSKRHPDYDREATIEKALRTGGPFKCETFAGANPEGCEGCPFRNKIAGPIMLGREVEEAPPEPAETPEEDVEETVEVEQMSAATKQKKHYTIPPYPEPYFRGVFGGVWVGKMEEQEDGSKERVDVPVYLNDFYYTQRIYDPDEGETLLARLHLPHDGVREFLLPLTKATAKDQLRLVLSGQGVSCNQKEWDQLMSYTNTWTNHLQHTQAADVARRQFGWTSPDMESFVIGDREIFADHVEYSPPSAKTAALFPAFEKQGTLESWVEMADFYNREGMEMYQFVVGLTLGSPLMEMTAMNAAVFLMHTEDSGFGKTTTQHFALSGYGNPALLMGQQTDTANSRMNQLEVLKNLPYQYDEATNTDPMDASNFIYGVHTGSQKRRMKSSANEERARGVPWKMSIVMSANQSLVSKVMGKKDAPKAEIQRILEHEPKRFPFNNKSETDAFQSRVGQDVGHAAEPMIQYIIENRDEVRELMRRVQEKLDKACKLESQNRFWSVTGVVGIVGILIAKEVGLVSYDTSRLFDWVRDMILDNRRRDAAVTLDGDNLLSDYVAENYSNILWIKSTDDMRASKHETGLDSLVTPEQLPKGKLVARYETDLKRLYLVIRPFQKWCAERQINYDALIQRMQKDMPVEVRKVRLGKGTKLNLPPSSVLVVDCSSIDMGGKLNGDDD